ncbi:hypothetical protein ACJRO7_028581 [Eucalyptus globulus]|uniref:Pyrrolo-quinoline quinone repeat domain-containing protein n=1 Tax=Eucalyptus globulus TaxID=34317 RepID=A0ABD3JVK2_EUCGL
MVAASLELELMAMAAVMLLHLSLKISSWWRKRERDTRSAREEKLIDPPTVGNLRLRWKFFAAKDISAPFAGKNISATPAVADAVVYFPSWDGNLYAVNAFDGSLVWKQNLSELTGLKGVGTVVNVTLSRSTPTIARKPLISTQLDPHPLAVITTSKTAYMGAFYVGVSSTEEGLPTAKCCTFRGSLVKLNILSGEILWQTYTLPDNGGELGGYAGASIWGSSPAIDPKKRLAYAATGNLYTAPAKAQECQARQNNQTTPPTAPDQCIGPDVNFNSIIAFEMETGRIRWARQLGGYDVWYFACLVPNSTDCPTGPNVDADFGEAPMLITISTNGTERDIAIAVQKSGFAWAVDRDSGDIVWFRARPDSIEGGGTWGAATNGKRVYTNIANGAWVALDACSGEILWSTANPSNEIAPVPVSVANGVIFAGSVAPEGPVYAMDAETGKILSSYNSGATVYGGISISCDCIYHGNGYKLGLAAPLHPTWTGGTDLYALCVK